MNPTARLMCVVLALQVASCDVYRDENDSGIGNGAPPEANQIDQTASLGPPPGRGISANSAGGASIIIRPGQTLYAVAREQGVPLRALIDANDLTAPYLLRAGQTLIVPHVRTYLVRPGDTLDDVAALTGVDAPTLTKLNHLNPPYVLTAGAILVLPAGPTRIAGAVPTSAPTPSRAGAPEAHSGGIVAQSLPPPSVASPAHSALPAKAPAAEPAPIPPQLPERPAPSPATTPGPVATALPPPVAAVPAPKPVLAPPQQLAPPVAAVPAVSPAPPAAVAAKPAPPASSPPPVKAAPVVVTPAPPPPEPTPHAPVAAAPGPDVAAVVSHHHPPSAPLFYWPVRGKVLATFGEGEGGTRNDGINVAAAEGTEIDAAESGSVAFVGDQPGYGNLILIKHPDGWVTAYAHAKTLLVKKGDHVRRGQAIAQVGTTGGVDRPQVHFELREGVKAVDPLDHLPSVAGDGE